MDALHSGRPRIPASSARLLAESSRPVVRRVRQMVIDGAASTGDAAISSQGSVAMIRRSAISSGLVATRSAMR